MSLTSVVYLGDGRDCYTSWPSPVAILSDGAYGVSGFPGDPPTPRTLRAWYEPHLKAWASRASALTTLWFWNTEVGWATVHPAILDAGFEYVGCNVWNKGMAHVAGNVNTKTARRFPPVTEVCAQYVFEEPISGMSRREWLLSEWDRSGLPRKRANDACGVKDAASRKYFAQDHLWYPPPPDAYVAMAAYARTNGLPLEPGARPYFTDADGVFVTAERISARGRFHCPFGVTNVWEAGALRGEERVRDAAGKVLHANQKPLVFMRRLIEASTDPGDVVWEPFGGLMTATLAAHELGRRPYAAEIDPEMFAYAHTRLSTAGALP